MYLREAFVVLSYKIVFMMILSNVMFEDDG